MNWKKALGIGALVLGMASLNTPAISEAEQGKKLDCKLKKGCKVEYHPYYFRITGKTSKGEIELMYQDSYYQVLTFDYKTEVEIWDTDLNGKADKIENEKYGRCYGDFYTSKPQCPKTQLKDASAILAKYKKKMNFETALEQFEKGKEPNYLEGIE